MFRSLLTPSDLPEKPTLSLSKCQFLHNIPATTGIISGASLGTPTAVVFYITYLTITAFLIILLNQQFSKFITHPDYLVLLKRQISLVPLKKY